MQAHEQEGKEMERRHNRTENHEYNPGKAQREFYPGQHSQNLGNIAPV
jgi:hypothetical protein